MQSQSLLQFETRPKRVTEADRVLAAIDRHYRRAHRKGVIPMWVRQRRNTVVLNAVQRSSTALHRLSVKAWLKADLFRQRLCGSGVDRKTLLRLAKHELKLARYWRVRATAR